jgi:hypothetical protein
MAKDYALMLLLLDFIGEQNRALLLSPEGDLTARGEKSLITLHGKI